MNVNIDVKTAVNSLKSFIKDHGGQPHHSDTLEFFAKMFGFTNYRAMKAASETTSPAQPVQVTPPDAPIQGQIRHTTYAPVEGRLLEDPQHVVFRGGAVDWELTEKSEEDRKAFPENRQRKYDFLVEQYGSQYRVMMKPEGIGLDNFDGQPVLDMLVEINEGVPCVHITNDPQDAMLLTVFATGQGILARQDDGKWGVATRSLPAEMRELVNSACSYPPERNRSHVCLHDTKELYGDQKPMPTSLSEPIQAIVALKNTRFPQFEGKQAMVKVVNSAPLTHQLMLVVGLLDEEGNDSYAGQDDIPFPGPASFHTAIRLDQVQLSESMLKTFAQNAAETFGYLVEGGIDIFDAIELIRRMANCQPESPLEPMAYAQRFIGLKPEETAGHTSKAKKVEYAYARILNYLGIAE